MSSKGLQLLTFATVLQKVIAFLFFTIVTYFVSPESLGLFVWAMAYTTIAGFFVDWGLAPAITRLVSKLETDDISGNTWLSSSWTIRLVSSIVVYFVVLLSILIIYGFDQSAIDKMKYVSLSGLIMIFDSFISWASSVWRGKHQLKYEAMCNIWYQAVVILLGTGLLYLTKDVFWIFIAYITASLSSAFYLHYELWKQGLWRPNLILKYSSFITVISDSWAIIISGALIKFYNFFDSILVEKLAGTYQLGLYALANKIILALQFLPNTFSAKYYALFSSEYHKHNYQKISEHFERFLFISFLLGSILMCLVFFMSGFVVENIFSDYQGSILMINILAVSLPAIFINFPLGSFLNATHRSGTIARNLGFILLLNITIDIIFIPHFGGLAAATSASFCNWLMILINGNAVTEVLRQEKERTGSERFVSQLPWLETIAVTSIIFFLSLFVYFYISSLVALVCSVILFTAFIVVRKLWQPYFKMFFEDYQS